jgi:hypothetical protein
MPTATHRPQVRVRRRAALGDELRSLAQRLVRDPPDALIRRDRKYAELGLNADGLGIDEVVSILAEHPPCSSARSSMTARPR